MHKVEHFFLKKCCFESTVPAVDLWRPDFFVLKQLSFECFPLTAHLKISGLMIASKSCCKNVLIEGNRVPVCHTVWISCIFDWTCKLHLFQWTIQVAQPNLFVASFLVVIGSKSSYSCIWIIFACQYAHGFPWCKALQTIWIRNKYLYYIVLHHTSYTFNLWNQTILDEFVFECIRVVYFNPQRDGCQFERWEEEPMNWLALAKYTTAFGGFPHNLSTSC